MYTYKFNVDLCGGCCGGEIEVKAKDIDKAYGKAIDYVGKQLYKAFPTLEIDYDVEFTGETDDEEFADEEGEE